MTILDSGLPLTLPHALCYAAEHFGDATAVDIEGRQIGFRQLEALVERAAGAFIACGVGGGDRVAIWAPNSLEWIVAALGVHWSGGVVVPLNTRFKGREAGYILARSGARLLCTVAQFLGVRYPELLTGESLPALERTILLDGEAPGCVEWGRFLAGGEATAPGERRARLARLSGGHIADILFTSGTTGAPKGVMSAHEQNIRVYHAWSEAVDLRRSDRYLIVNPFFHTFGYKAGWVGCLIRGAAAFPMAVFDAGVVLDRIARERITFIPGPPTLFQSMLAHEQCGRTDTSSLRIGGTGAAVVPPILIRQMREVLGFQRVFTAYGLTEATGTVSVCRAGDSDERVARTCGRAIPGVEIKCIDEDGGTLPRGATGELLVRGFNVMRGYFDDPQATAEAIDADGWLHTGDVAVIDEQGYLSITDRKKDLYIVGGFNCYPAEIEKILCAHPSIAQAAVVGIEDERMGEVGKAFVVLKPGHGAEPASIIEWSRANMANYKVPRFVEIVASLPMNAAGKVQKFALRGRS
ncbi:MAG TPA: FadD3 family acyl-CoA ligase [Steroidobacteraceae bacterium]|nr:FadD3 family acyl-CoA ligase [Steroidobacteraceae bacterium]